MQAVGADRVAGAIAAGDQHGAALDILRQGGGGTMVKYQRYWSSSRRDADRA